jgi:hypothetical protein
MLPRILLRRVWRSRSADPAYEIMTDHSIRVNSTSNTSDDAPYSCAGTSAGQRCFPARRGMLCLDEYYSSMEDI